MTAVWHEMVELVGSRVRVTMDHEDSAAKREGLLMALDEDGEAVVDADDGLRYYCWPALDITALD